MRSRISLRSCGLLEKLPIVALQKIAKRGWYQKAVTAGVAFETQTTFLVRFRTVQFDAHRVQQA